VKETPSKVLYFCCESLRYKEFISKRTCRNFC